MKIANRFTSLDIGTTKIVCVISMLDNFGQLNIQGLGEIPWDGLRKGVVANVNKTAEIIRKAVGLAEHMAGVEAREVWVDISGEQIKSFTSTGMAVIQRKRREITERDRTNVIDAAQAVSLPGGNKILHAIPQEFIVDGQQGIEQPVGMHGIRLESRVLICTGAITSVKSIEKSVKMAGLKVAGIVLDPIASGCAVLSDSEKKMGVALLDIGGQIMNIALYIDDVIHYISIVGIGSSDITRDIARALQVPLKTAEELKIRIGCSHVSFAKNDKSDGGEPPPKWAKKVSKEELAAIIEPRTKEILLRAKEEIKKSGYGENLGSGIVLAGGGVLLNGIREFAEKIFKIQTRIGIPSGFGGLVENVASPAQAAAVGLCVYAAGHAGAVKESDGDNVWFEGLKKFWKK